MSDGDPLAADRAAAIAAQAQALQTLLAYAEASEPRVIAAFGALCAGAAFLAPTPRAAAVLRAASARMLRAAGAEARR